VTAIAGAILLAALAVMTAILLRDVPSPEGRSDVEAEGALGSLSAG
jgi:hypothetical protein